MKRYLNNFLATGLLAILPLAAFAQEARPRDDVPQPPAAEQTTAAAQPPDSGQSQPVRAEPVTAAPQPSAGQVKSERELAKQVSKAKSLVSQLDKALKSARTDTERERLRAELAKAQSTAKGLERNLVDASARLSEADNKVDQAARKIASIEAEKKRVEDEKKRLKEESERRRKSIIYTAFAAGIVLALGALVATVFQLRSRNRSKKLSRDLEHRKQVEELRDSANDWLLVGEHGRLKLRGVLLATEGRGSIVGRGQTDADVIIDDKDDSISRRHARFFYRDDALYVEDLRSLNGTFVNGERVNSGRIKLVRDQDELRFGKLNFNLRRV